MPRKKGREDEGNERQLFLRYARSDERQREEELSKQIHAYRRLAAALQAERRKIIRKVYVRGYLKENPTKRQR